MRLVQIFLILGVLATALGAAKPTLYAVTSYFTGGTGGKASETASHIVQLDKDTGVVTDMIEVLLYAGSSLTYDGIAAMDTTNGVYYYATDGNNNFMFRGSVQTGKLMSPVVFPLMAIDSITYDSVEQRMIVVGPSKQGISLISLPTDESEPFSTITTLPSGALFSWATIDAANQMYYYQLLTVVNSTMYYTSLNSMSLTNPSQQKSMWLKNCGGPAALWPNGLIYDTNVKVHYTLSYQFVTEGHMYHTYYYITTVHLDQGTCNAVSVAIDNTAVVSDWTYDQNTQIAYTAASINGANLLYHIHVPTATILKTVKVQGYYVPESLALY